MPDTGHTQKPVIHIAYLDSIRGIAAMAVVVYHFLNWDYKELSAVKITNLFINGADAVAFFFVLSGFVLSYKYVVLKHPLDIGKFYINRFFRLWPAFFITVIINALYQHWDTIGTRKLVDLFILNKHAFWQEALLIRPTAFVYYVPGWTLVIELIMSMFVPFVVIIAHNNIKNLWWLSAFFFFMGAGLLGLGMFISHFVYGVLIASYYMFISSNGFKNTKAYRFRYIIIPIALVLFSMRPIEKLITMGSFYDEVIFKYLGYDVFYFSGVGSFILLVYIIHSRSIQKLLEKQLFRFIGKVSYGIYLMHWMVVTYIFNNRPFLSSFFPSDKTAFFSLLAIAIVVTIILAVVVYYCIELPFIRIGKRLTARMKPTLVINSGV